MEHIYHLSNFGEDWFTYPRLYADLVKRAYNGSRFVEVGSWKGKSSAYMAVEIANSGKNIEFICVDTWAGGIEQGPVDPEELYRTFLKNMEPVQNYYKHFRMSSLEAAKLFPDRCLDFVFIDASHQYEDVKADIVTWLPKVRVGGILAGHDYYTPEQDYFPGVRQAVHECLDIFTTSENCWVYTKD